MTLPTSLPLLRALTAAVLLASAAAFAGPPLVCHPYQVGDRPELMGPPALAPGAPAAAVRDELLRVLDAEPETLVRMEAIRRSSMAVNGFDSTDREEGEAGLDLVLAGLDERASRARAAAAAAEQKGGDAKLARAAAMCEFEAAFARETFRWLRSDISERVSPELLRMEATVLNLADEPAAWFALARGRCPLVNSGSEAAHASVFVRARDLALAMADSPARQHLLESLDYDLGSMESYLLDTRLQKRGVEPTNATRQAELERIAADAVVKLLTAPPALMDEPVFPFGSPLLAALGRMDTGGVQIHEAQRPLVVEALTDTARGCPQLAEECKERAARWTAGRCRW